MQNHLRQLPSIDALLNAPQGQQLIADYGHPLTTEACRHAVEQLRQRILDGEDLSPSIEDTLAHAHHLLEQWLTPTLRSVINATGVIIHTNLGRAPLSTTALGAIQRTASGYSTLEFDLATGERGSRETHIEALFTRLTGAEAALMVNNNAAATMLTLSALAGAGQGVVVSRGQLVEIGGGYRMPDVMATSGARMIEVGTTNRTHLRDYATAIDEGTSALIRVHHSNYAVVGFTTEPTIEQLAQLARERGVLLIDDLGSGALLDTSQFGLKPEPTVQQSIAAGADAIMFSGDKLLGGPQAGVIVGKAAIVERIRRHPLARAVRADKLAIAAMTATLQHYLRGDVLTNIPVWQMISATADELHNRAHSIQAALAGAGLPAALAPGESTVGGGSVPGSTLPTTLVTLDVANPTAFAALLRDAHTPIITRIQDDKVIIDPRTVLDENQLIQTVIQEI